MWESSSSGFGDESPILNKPLVKKFNVIDVSKTGNITLEELHTNLMVILQKAVRLNNLSRKKELHKFYQQVQNMNPTDPKSKWLLMKIKGLLHYILKNQKDFRSSIVKGEITIYEKSPSEPINCLNEIPQSSQYQSRPCDGFAVPSNLLTNNNFITVDHKMDIENSYNYSADLFGDTVDSLHNFSQENFQLLKCITNNNETSLFKMPPIVDKIDDVQKIYETIEQDYSSIISLTPSTSQTKVFYHGNNEVVPQYDIQQDLFDNLIITNDELKAQFEKEFELTQSWISDIVSSMMYLQNRASSTIMNNSMENQNLNETSTTSKSLPIKAHYSEENFKIIKEVCSEFKKNLKKEMENNKDLEILNELISF